MHAYYFKSSVGVFRIFPFRGNFWLEIDRGMYSAYISPKEAAIDVYMHTTGHNGWDKLKGIEDAPEDLSGWRYL